MAFPNPLFVLLKDDNYLVMSDVFQINFTDNTNYTGANYRDTLDAGFIGRAPPSDLNINAPNLLTIDEAYANGQSDYHITADQTTIPGSTITTTNIDENILLLMQESDQYLHVEPRFEENTRTMIEFVNAAGDQVGMCWADRFIGFGDAIPTYAGSAPPAYTP